MSVGWQKVRLPIIERVILADLAGRLSVTEEEALRIIIRDAALKWLIETPARPVEREEQNDEQKN